jgi:hypothetical protein
VEQALTQQAAQQANRPIYVFELPPEQQALDDRYIKKTVGFVKLTMREELQALDLAGGSAAKAGYYMVITAIVEVDGRMLNKGEAEDELILNNTDPAIRSLIVEAQTDLSGTSKETSKAFLGSRKVKIG